MPRQQQSLDEKIVFEDLHGDTDEASTTVEVDLNAQGDDDGITRHARTSSDDGTATGGEVDGGIDYGTGDDPAGDDGDDTQGGEDDDQDRDKFSRKFQSRLRREQRAKRKEADRAEAAERDNARLRKQLKASKTGDREDKNRDLDRQIETAETDLAQAIEAGDSKKQVRLTGDLTDLKAERIAAKYTSQDDDDDDDLDADPGSRRRPSSETNELAEDWVDRHGAWYNKPRFSRFTRIAKTIDKEVHEDGFEPDEDEYWEEVDKRLAEELPELFDKDGEPVEARDLRRGGSREKRRDKRSNKGRSPVAPADDGGRDRNQGGKDDGKVQMGPVEFANMRRFGLNPNDPKAVKEYAMNKRQADAEERSNAR